MVEKEKPSFERDAYLEQFNGVAVAGFCDPMPAAWAGVFETLAAIIGKSADSEGFYNYIFHEYMIESYDQLDDNTYRLDLISSKLWLKCYVVVNKSAFDDVLASIGLNIDNIHRYATVNGKLYSVDLSLSLAKQDYHTATLKARFYEIKDNTDELPL